MDISFHYKYDGGEKQGEKSKAHKLAPLTGSAVRATITSVGQSGAGRRTRCPPDTSRFGIITENSETESAKSDERDRKRKDASAKNTVQNQRKGRLMAAVLFAWILF